MPPKQKGQITKIATGNWQLRIQRRAKDGKRKSLSESGFKTRADADERLKELLEEIAEAKKIAKNKPNRIEKTFDELFDEYLFVIKPHIREQTYLLYERIIRLYLRDFCGKLSIHELDSHAIEKYYARLQAKLKPETIYKIHTQLKTALRRARQWRWMKDNPLSDIRTPKRIKEIKETLTPDELNLFFEACPTSESRAMWLFFALTGCRAQEVLGARWQDVNFERGFFKVSQVCVEAKGVKKFDKPKTAKSERVLPLPDELLSVLKKHRKSQLEFRLKAGSGWTDNDLIFPTSRGNAQRLSNLGIKCTAIKERAGIEKNVTPHLFRHSFATLAIKSGENIKAVSEYLGHASIKITSDVYTHLQAEDTRSVSNKVSGLLKVK